MAAIFGPAPAPFEEDGHSPQGAVGVQRKTEDNIKRYLPITHLPFTRTAAMEAINKELEDHMFDALRKYCETRTTEDCMAYICHVMAVKFIGNCLSNGQTISTLPKQNSPQDALQKFYEGGSGTAIIQYDDRTNATTMISFRALTDNVLQSLSPKFTHEQRTKLMLPDDDPDASRALAVSVIDRSGKDFRKILLHKKADMDRQLDNFGDAINRMFRAQLEAHAPQPSG